MTSGLNQYSIRDQFIYKRRINYSHTFSPTIDHISTVDHKLTITYEGSTANRNIQKLRTNKEIYGRGIQELSKN